MLYFQVFFFLQLHVFLDFFYMFLISLNVLLIFCNLFVCLFVGFHCCFGFILQVSKDFGLFFLTFKCNCS